MVEWRTEDRAARNFWQDLLSLRQLFIRRCIIPIDQLAAPNLVYLALEQTGYRQDITLQSILNMLHGCPLLETLLIPYSGIQRGGTRDHSPVRLPSLRSLELGPDEVHCGLVLHLQFPKKIAAGFRMMPIHGMWYDVPQVVKATIRHALRRINIRCITLAAPLRPIGILDLLIRFDGLGGSLEITTCGLYFSTGLLNIFFSSKGVLSS